MARKRLQFNIDLKPISYIPLTNKLRRTLVPLIWVEEVRSSSFIQVYPFATYPNYTICDCQGLRRSVKTATTTDHCETYESGLAKNGEIRLSCALVVAFRGAAWSRSPGRIERQPGGFTQPPPAIPQHVQFFCFFIFFSKKHR